MAGANDYPMEKLVIATRGFKGGLLVDDRLASISISPDTPPITPHLNEFQQVYFIPDYAAVTSPKTQALS